MDPLQPLRRQRVSGVATSPPLDEVDRDVLVGAGQHQPAVERGYNSRGRGEEVHGCYTSYDSRWRGDFPCQKTIAVCHCLMPSFLLTDIWVCYPRCLGGNWNVSRPPLRSKPFKGRCPPLGAPDEHL